MRKTQIVRSNVKKFLVFSAIAVLLALSLAIFGITYSGLVKPNIADAAADTRGSNATNALTPTVSYSGNTINLAVGTPSTSNISWSAYSKDGQVYALNLGNGKFGVKRGDDYKNLNTYVATLNVAIPEWIQELAASSTVTATITGDYYCYRWRHMVDDSEFYFGVTQSSSLIKKSIDLSSSSVRDNIDENKGESFLPGYSSIYNQKSDTGITVWETTGSYSGSLTLSSSSKYIGIGLSGHADTANAPIINAGYSTPESYLQNIKISITINTAITVKCNANGSFEYYWYPNATATSSGSPSSSSPLKISAGNSFEQKNISNPFAYVVVIPKETTNGYRFQNVKISGTAQTLGYDPSDDVAPNAVGISLFPDSKLSGINRKDSAHSYSYNFRQSTAASEVNFTERQYTIRYYANNDTPSYHDETYKFGEAVTVPNPTDYFTNGKSAATGWTHTGDSKGNTADKVYSSGNSYSNILPTLKNNTTTVYFEAIWVDASASTSDGLIVKLEPSEYSDKYSDVTFTITTKDNTGYTLVQVYATYTSGDLSGHKIALEQTQAPNSSNVSKWVLYGISGNCNITTEWKANTYKITYSYESTKTTSISSTNPSSYVYGIGVNAYQLPYITAKAGYIWQGWSAASATGSVISTSAALNSTTGDKTLYAVFTAHATKMTVSDTTDVTDATNITNGLANGSYVKNGDNISNTSVTLDVATSRTVLSASQLGWAYKNVDKNLTNYAYYYIKLDGNAEKLLRSGYSVRIDITASYKVGAFNGKTASSDATAKVGIGVYAGISDTSTNIPQWGDEVKGSTNQGGMFSASKWTETTGSVSNYCTITSTTSVPVIRLNLGGKFVCVKPISSEYACYGYFTAITYKLTWTKPGAKSITFNANNGDTLTNTNLTWGIYSTNNQNYKLPSNPFNRTGYEFVGWSTSPGASASSATAPGTSVTLSGAATYYAIWTKKKYPVTTYDVWKGEDENGNAAYATTIRKQYYVTYNSTVYFNPTDTTTTTYKGTSYADIYAYAGGGDYKGFSLPTTTTERAFQITTHNNQTHKYQYGNETSSAVASSITGTAVTGAIWGYYIWELNIPTVETPGEITVDYGTAVDTDEIFTEKPNHGADDKTLTWIWYKDGDEVDYYNNEDHELFLAQESNEHYSVIVTVEVTRGGKKLYKRVSPANYTDIQIKPIRLTVALDGKSKFDYNGEEQEFPMKAVVDEKYYRESGYSDADIAKLAATFERESNKNGFHSWFYEEDNAQTNPQWSYGVEPKLMGLGYASFIASERSAGTNDFYSGSITGNDTNKRQQFKDAGTYWANQLYILQAWEQGAISNSAYNKNYVWANNEQSIAPESPDDGGTVTAEILPADGFDIYALYVQKTFGTILDPTPSAYRLAPTNGSFDVADLRESFGIADGDQFTAWILALDGLFDNDYNTYAKLIAAKLKRDETGMSQKAGLYDVYLDGFISEDFLPLLNNYGVKLGAATDTVALSGYGAVKMRWVSEDGSIKSGSFDFTAEVSAYSGETNNFEIVAKDITLEYTGATTYTYTGKPQGPNNIITRGYLDETQKQAFAAEYGPYFDIYFYGIPLSYNLDWAAMTAEQQAQHIADAQNNGEAVIVGYEDDDEQLNYVTGVNKYAISLFEKNAGKYAVVIFAAAYKDADGNFHENVSFNIAEPLYIHWEIQQSAISIETQHTSTVFGDVNYGGTKYTFSINDVDADIQSQDQIKIRTITVNYRGASADGFLRYSDLSADTAIESGSIFSVYGTFVGEYNVSMSGTVTDGMEDATGLYGIAGESYGRADSNYSLSNNDKFTITARTLTTGAAEYTNDYISKDSNENFYPEIPANLTESFWIYTYGKQKGIRVKISNFYAAGFLTDDIAAKEGDNVLVAASDLVDTVANEIYDDSGRIKLTRTHANSVCEFDIDSDTASITYSFTAVNAATYGVSLTRMTYTCDGKTYGNYSLTETSTSFTIKPKTINVEWYLDGTAVKDMGLAQDAIPSKVYNAKEHSVSAKFIAADGNVLRTDDGKVYAEDFKSDTEIYSVYQKKNALSLEFSADGTNAYTDVNVVDGADTSYETYLKLLTTGNYRLAESGEGSYALEWEITRRPFVIEAVNAGNVYIYNGNPHQAVLNLKSDLDGENVAVVLDSFSAIINSSGANFHYSPELVFNANNRSFSATDSGIYTLSYNAGENGIPIDKNWLLTGSANYSGISIGEDGQLVGADDENNGFLFAIAPRVLILDFLTTAATYNATNLVGSRFVASHIDSEVTLPDGDTAFTYNLTEIIHAGSYEITVDKADSASGNFVLAELNPTAWYAAIADGRHYDYYTDEDVIREYTATVTVNPYTVTIDPVALNDKLSDYVYDGLEHGYTLADLYVDLVKSKLLNDADKAAYTLKGTSETGKNVGTYEVAILGFNPIEIDGKEYTDYRLAEANGYSDTWSITKRPLTFDYTAYHSGGSAYVYDGNDHGYTLVVKNIVDGESVTLNFTGTRINITSPLTVGSVNSTNIYGSAAASYSIAGFAIAAVNGDTELASNYYIEGSANKSWTIEKLTITVEWHNTELTYRASVYNPTNGGVYATVTNSVGGDSFTLNYGGQYSATDAGEYTVTIEDITGGAYANYKIEGTLSTAWTIKAKELTEFAWEGVGSGWNANLEVTYNAANRSIKATPAAGAAGADDGKLYDADATNFTFNYSSASGFVISALLAGEYTTKISGCNNPNYTIPASADVEKAWKILERELTVTYTYANGITITYCAAARGVTLTISGFIASDYDADLIKFTVDTDVESAGVGSASGTAYTQTLRSTNAGKYTASVRIDGTCTRAGCYKLIGTTDAAFEIVPLTATLSWQLCDTAHAGRTAEYDGKAHELKAAVSNAYSSDEVTVTVKDGVATNKGSYTGVATALYGASASNYRLPDGETACSCTFTITARTINAVWESTAAAYTYNGQYQSDTLTLSRLVAGDAVRFKVEFSKESGGTVTAFKTATVDKTGAAEYDLTASDFGIIDAATYVAVFDGKVYNADGTVNADYTFAASGGNDKTRFTVSRATLALTGEWKYYSDGALVGTFDESSVLVYNSKEYVLKTEIKADSLFVRADSGAKDEVSLAYTGNKNTHVGTGAYTAAASSLTGTGAANYRLPSDGVSVSYAITPKGVDLVWENHTDIVYDGQTHTVTAKVSFGASNDTDGLAYTGDTVTVSQYKDNAQRAADGYTSSALALGNADYTIKSNFSLDWTIAPRPAELSWSPKTVEYDGTEKTVTATVSNLVSGDSLTLTYANNKYTDKGDYTAEVTALGGSSASNYTLTDGKSVEHEWSITPIVLAFGWSSASGLIYNGNAQGVTLTVSNIADADYQNADKLSFTVTEVPASSQTVNETRTANPITISFKATNAGSYTVTITALGGSSADNYVLPDNASATYTIAKRVIDVDWTTGTFVYNTQSHSVSAALTNAVAGDTVSLTYKTTNTATNEVTNDSSAINAGSYTTVITAVSETNSNYTVTGASDLSCNWTVSPKTITQVTYTLDGSTALTTAYNNAPHTLIATAEEGAESDDDGKVYDGDSVGFVYAGTVVTNYGLSAINKNSATNAGVYKVTLTGTDNGNYSVSSLDCEFTVSRRVLTLSSEDVTTTSFVYNGKQQGVKITVNNLVEADNTSARFSLDGALISPTATATAESAVRSGASYTKRFLATDAGTYGVTFALSGSRSQNYELTPFDCSFTIVRKEINTRISAEITANNIVYRAAAITASDLLVTFTNVVTGESLTLGSDFTVAFAKDGGVLDSAPIDVGTYTAKISLKEDGAASKNYTLAGAGEDGAADFEFKILPYEITPDMLNWTLGGKDISLGSLTYASGEHKTVTVGTVNDTVFNKIIGKSFGYVYFGLCNCGLEAKSPADLDEEHLTHQWLTEGGSLQTAGPEHAGSYFVVLTLSGGDSANFVLAGFDGYDGDYFTVDGEDTYLVYQKSTDKFMNEALPELGGSVGAKRFGIGRLHQGVVVDSTPTLPYKGSAYTVSTGLPTASAEDTSNIRVEIGSGTYTYAEYSADTFNAIKNADEYTIKIYDNSASGESGTVSGCDLFNSDAKMEVVVNLTIEKAKITVTDSVSPYWSKVYDRNTSYFGYSFATGVTFASTTDGDGNVTATSDGVLTGTTATVTAAYDDYNAGTGKTLTFTLGGTDSNNYYLEFSENGTALVKDTDYTVSGNAYAITKAEITKRTISVAGDADKVFDGNDIAAFTVVSSDILSGDSVTVTGTYASAHVGTHAIIFTVTNENYELADGIAVQGTISPAPITVVWTNTDSTAPIYDGQAHGVSATVTGMISGYIEEITATIGSETSTIGSAATYPVSFTRVNAGDYSVTLSLKANSDYTLSSTDDTKEWSIAQRELEISWATDTLHETSGNEYYYAWEGFTVAYSGVARYITPSITNLVGTDKVTLTVSDNSKTAVGDYTAKITGITGDGAGNYALPETAAQAFKIKKATITSITLPDLTTVYNGKAQGVEVSAYETQHGITVNVVYSGGEAKTADTVNGNNAFINVTGDAGRTVTATIAESDYYEKWEKTATVIINPSPITSITLTGRTFTYDGTDKSISVNKVTTDYGDTVTVTYTVDGNAGNSAKNAGAYTVVATVAADDDNYVTLTRTATLTINKADIDPDRITVNTDAGSIVYDAEYHGIVITVTDSETQYGDAVTVTYRGGEDNSGQAKNVGTYTINAVVSAGDNYNDYTTATSTLTITQKEIKLTVAAADASFTYDGTAHTATAAFEAGAENKDDYKVYDADADTLKVTLRYLGTSGVADGDTVLKNSGKYTVSATLSSNNYKPIFDDAEITVKKAEITGYDFADDTFVYDNRTRTLSVTDKNGDPISGTINLLGTDKATVSYLIKTESGEYGETFTGAKNAGTYYLKATITANGAAAGNYETWEETATMVISPSPITSFTMEDVTVTYDGLSHSITVTVADPDKQLVDGVYYTAHGDKVTITYTVTDGKGDAVTGNSAINVNTVDGAVAAYVITASCSFDGEIAGNYLTDDLSIEAELTITPVTLKNITLAGENAEYDGNEHNATLSLPSGDGYPTFTLNADKTKLTVRLADGHDGDVFTVTQFIDGFDGKARDAGSYDFVAQITPDSSIAGNYAPISELRKTIVISKAKAADRDGTVYKQGENLFFNDANVEYCAGTHYIVLASESANSGITHTAADVVSTLALHPSTNTAVSDNADIVYTCGGAEFEGAKNVGTYTVTATVSHKNYQTFTLTGTITITQAKVEYYFKGATVTYDMAAHYAGVNSENEYLDGTVTTISLKGTDTATVSYTYKLNGTDMGRFTSATYVGAYTITATLTFIGDVGSNYETWGTNDTVTDDLVITPYQAEMIWEGLDGRFVYDGNTLGPVTAYFIGADGKTKVDATVSYLGISGKADGDTVLRNAGVYRLTASHARSANYEFVLQGGTADGDNYRFVSATEVNLTVKKATVDWYLAGTSAPYAAKTYFLSLNRSNSASLTEEPVNTITVYGETINIVYTYTKSGANAKDSYIDNGVYTELTYGARNAGTYTVTADLNLGEGESNFESWTSPKSATLTITRLNLTVTGTFEKTYDGTEDADADDYTINGVINDPEHIIFVAKYEDKNAGEGKTVTISADTTDGYEYLTDNYVLPSNLSGTILQRELNLIEGEGETDSQTSIIFWRKLYDGLTSTTHSPLALTSANNFIEGDALTLNSRFNSKNVKEANKVMFTLAGADRGNYTIANLDFGDVVDIENGVYLITPRVTDITWAPATKTAAYNGSEQSVTAYLSVLGEDVSGGQLNLTVALTYTHDSGNNELANAIENAVYKNAGTYLAAASLPDGVDGNILTNYGINADTMTSMFTITKASLKVSWTGDKTVYTYDGTDQSAKVSAAVTLRGGDVNKYKDVKYLVTVFSAGGEEKEFKNAGDYAVTARFADSVRAELGNNYTLTDSGRSLTVNKATVNNITFSGSDEWTYTDGTVHYYFVSDGGAKTYIVSVSGDGLTVPVAYYEFDTDTPIEIRYSGGDVSPTEIDGANGVRNVGTDGARTITATVAATDNYESWTGSITVNVKKGTINNIVMTSYETTYNGAAHYLYARNAGSDADDGVFSQVTAPDGSAVTIKYAIEIGAYFNDKLNEDYRHDYNYAVNAGIYLLKATVTASNGNYEELVLASTAENNITLTINPFKSPVVWAYNNETAPDFTYNATNQTSAIRASILGASTSGQTYIQLAVAISLQGDIEIDDVLKSQFVIAGDYSMTASFFASTDEELQKLINNYEPEGKTVNVTMKKYVVQINWYNDPKYHGGEKTPYDPENPCIYDAETHGLIAEGIGINGAVMDIITDGTFDAVDAYDKYSASVSGIAEGTDTVNVDGKNYEFAYELNYTLANTKMIWKLSPRPITIEKTDDSFLSKIYDGTAAFGFNSNGYTKSFIIDEANEKVVNIKVSYSTLRSAYPDSHFAYFINNVMAKDKDKVFLPISSINADKVNVLATSATVVFGDLTMEKNSNGTYNYEIQSVSDAIIQTNDDIITKRNVEMRFQNLSHVYNGETYSHEFTYAEAINGGAEFNERYGYTLFLIYNNSVRMQLVKGNYIVGTVTIGGYTDAGEYLYVVSGIKAVDAETDGVENYNITVSNLETAKYTIKQRKLGVTYSNLLQSTQTAFTDVGAALNLAGSDFADLNAEDETAAIAALNALVAKDGFALTVSNAWKDKTYAAYTRITGGVALDGEAADTLLTVFLNNANYTVDAPVLQITYLQIDNAEEYKFFIKNLDDLLHLDADNFGLNEMRGENDPLPIYTQTADIDGIVNGSYTVMSAIRNFRGYYLGGNHTISNITITQISDSESEDSAYAGFFARITEGSVKDLTLTGIHVYATGGTSSVGGFAGLIGENASVDNVSFNGILNAIADCNSGETVNEVAIGGFVGSAWSTSVSNVNAAVRMNVVHMSSDKLYVGGFAGLIEGGSYENISVFADLGVIYKSAPAQNAYFGGVAGYAAGEELTIENYRYLTSSVYVNDGTGAILYDKAFGNDVTFAAASGTDYDGFVAANDTLTELISENMIRDYLLPAGVNGTSASPVEITNFRQISLILAYPYMTFKVTRLVRSPIDIPTYQRGFYGAIIYQGDGKIRSDHRDSTSDTPLTDAVMQNVQNVIIEKKEEN